MHIDLSDLWKLVRARLFARVWSNGLSRGARAEQAAARYLRRHGYRLLGRNLRLAGGEIDLLAVHEEWLVIVEVRSYRRGEGRPPRETLSRDKQRRLRRLAEEVGKRPSWRSRRIRIDLVEVETDPEGRAVGFEVFKGI